jgi:HlyD family secretion protein
VPDPVPARVALISPALDPGSTTVEVWLRVENKKGALKVGTPVHALIEGRKAEKAVTVPSSAILTAQDGKKSVMVIGADGAAHAKPVTVGISNGEDVQILSGLTAADMVITSGNYALDEGTKVKVGAAGGEDTDDEKKPAAGEKDSGDAKKPAAGKDGDDK